jgi:hypothetical protein
LPTSPTSIENQRERFVRIPRGFEGHAVLQRT